MISKKKLIIFTAATIGILSIIPSGSTAPQDVSVKSAQDQSVVSSEHENVVESAVTPTVILTDTPTFTPTLVPTTTLIPTRKYTLPSNTPTPTTIKAPSPANQTNELSNNDYYINSAGNSVHSPAYSDTIPAGASALCRDGTYSFSQSRRGTCSSHGGVAQWL